MITEEEKRDLDRVQKIACKLIMKQNYTTYFEALKILQLETLEHRRNKLALTFGKKCVDNPKMRDLFTEKNEINMNLRKRNKYNTKFAYHDRLVKSPVVAIQNLLNDNFQKGKKKQ